jgi:hypothetical protein
MLLALALAAATTAAPAVPAKPLQLTLNACATGCTAEPTRSRYRLDPQADTGPDMKRTALATDGSACSIVGARVCTKKPRTVFATDLGN